MSVLIQFKQEQVEGKITTKVWSTGLQNTFAKQGCNPPNTIAILVKETENCMVASSIRTAYVNLVAM